MTLRGVHAPFFVGCHSAATLGTFVARQLVIEVLKPMQYGQFWVPSFEH